MTEAESRWEGSTPKEIKAASTEPAMVANPPVMTACSSDLVMTGRYGLISIGASVCGGSGSKN